MLWSRTVLCCVKHSSRSCKDGRTEIGDLLDTVDLVRNVLRSYRGESPALQDESRQAGSSAHGELVSKDVSNFCWTVGSIVGIRKDRTDERFQLLAFIEIANRINNSSDYR